MRARWATGFLAGPLAAIALLVLPALGLLMSIVVASLLLKARGLSALAGMLCGTGASALALLAQANARCAATYSGCSAPNVTGPVVIATALLTAGAALTLALFVQARVSRTST